MGCKPPVRTIGWGRERLRIIDGRSGANVLKIRMLEENVDGQNLLCPYVVCEACDEKIRGGGITVRDGRIGDVVIRAYHRGMCDPRDKPWRPLNDLLIQLMTNSGAREAP